MIYIIMCTYNGEKYIDEQLKSIEQNTVKEWELYVADDQSTDDTIRIVTEFGTRHQGQVHIKINKEKQGAVQNFLSAIWNVGRHMEKDDFIMLCDQDDIWKQDKIERTMHGMKTLIREYHNNIPLLVCTDVEVVDEQLNSLFSSFRKMNHYNINKLDFAHLMMENKVQGCTVMINRKLARMLSVIPKNATMHDGWLGLIAAAFGKIKYIASPTMKYRQHTNNVMGSLDFMTDVKNKMHNLDGQREIVFRTTHQITEFMEIYGDRLPKNIMNAAAAFSSLPERNFWMRRYHIVKYHLWKSGVLRNIGLMLLV